MASGDGRGGIPCDFAAILATHEEIDSALGDQRPPHKPPDLPHCYASDLKFSGSHREAIRSEHAHLWEDSTGWELYGSLDAGTFAPVSTTSSTPSAYTTERQMSTGGPLRRSRDL